MHYSEVEVALSKKFNMGALINNAGMRKSHEVRGRGRGISLNLYPIG